jgi:hypothetical protein
MDIKTILAPVAIVIAINWQVCAQTYDTNGVAVQTFAGSEFYGYLDGVGQLTMFNWPRELVADSTGNLFVWDSENRRIRKISPNGTVTTFVGGGTQPTGVGTNVSLSGITGMAIDRNDTIWLISDNFGIFLYTITSNATITRTDLAPAYARGICVDSAGNIYLSDWIGNRVYRYTNGDLSVFAGSGNAGYADGNGLFSAFTSPSVLAADGANNIYVWDSGNYLIRRIDQSQNVSTFSGKRGNSSSKDGVGTNAAFNTILQMCFDNAGNLILAGGTCIRKISATTNVTTLAGSFSQWGYVNGPGNLARFNGAHGVAVVGGTVCVADAGNQRIRSITNNAIPQPVLPSDLQINTYPGLKISGIVGRTYRIESSPDTTNWTTRATLVLNATPYLWIDQNPVNGTKFYRALLLP